MAYSTGIAVGCAVGIPVFLAFLVAFIFFVKTRRRLAREDRQFREDVEINNVNTDLSYDNINELRMDKSKEVPHVNPSSGSSDDGKIQDKQADSVPSSPKQEKKKRYVPAYRKQLRSSMTNFTTSSRNSSFSNLNNNNVQGSNSSINSINTTATDHFYSNVVPVLDDSNPKLNHESSSIDLAKTLQQPTPSYSKKVSTPTRSSTNSINDEEYNLKNNYDVANEFEIQEEDQYENEFTNYSENKRTFIESLRPKTNQ